MKKEYKIKKAYIHRNNFVNTTKLIIILILIISSVLIYNYINKKAIQENSINTSNRDNNNLPDCNINNDKNIIINNRLSTMLIYYLKKIKSYCLKLIKIKSSFKRNNVILNDTLNSTSKDLNINKEIYQLNDDNIINSSSILIEEIKYEYANKEYERLVLYEDILYYSYNKKIHILKCYAKGINFIKFYHIKKSYYNDVIPKSSFILSLNSDFELIKINILLLNIDLIKIIDDKQYVIEFSLYKLINNGNSDNIILEYINKTSMITDNKVYIYNTKGMCIYYLLKSASESNKDDYDEFVIKINIFNDNKHGIDKKDYYSIIDSDYKTKNNDDILLCIEKTYIK